MANRQAPTKAMNVTLWVAQVLLAATMLWAAAMKLFQPISKLSAMWPWTADIPEAAVKLMGLIDLMGALGLILPQLLRIKPKLTAVTAICIIVLMVCASAFHILRGEASLIGVNLFFALLAVFIAWGRQ